MDKMSRIAPWLLLALALMGFVLIGGGIYYNILDGDYINPVITFKEFGDGITHVTTKMQYKPGEQVYATIDATKHRSTVGQVWWIYKDGCWRTREAHSGALGASKGQVKDKEVYVSTVPKEAKLGKGKYFEGDIVYPLAYRNHTVSIKTNKFEVVE